jgi:predicted nucleic acid-binding Zn ribbon protein
MPERLPQHKHCITCGKAVSPKDEYCSDDCERRRVDTLARKKKQLLLLYAISIGVVIVAFILAMV